MASTFTIKQNNTVVLSCTTTESLAGNNIISAIRDTNGYTKPLSVIDIEDKAFKIILNTANLAEGPASMDIKVGNVSSETIIIDIEKSIA